MVYGLLTGEYTCVAAGAVSIYIHSVHTQPTYIHSHIHTNIQHAYLHAYTYMSRQTLVEEKEELVRAFQMTKDVIEEDADREIEDLKSRYDQGRGISIRLIGL